MLNEQGQRLFRWATIALKDGHVSKASWTLLDQGIVSLGNFIVNIVLARHVAPAEYGVFALLWGGLLSLQQINAALVFHPMSVRLVVAQGERQKSLFTASMALVGMSCVPQCLLLSATLVYFGRADLVAPAATWFVLWQVQETTRRGLFAGFRHKAAMFGDAISYLGQAVIVALLLTSGRLDLTVIIYSIAATSGLAALVQAYQVGLSFRLPLGLRGVIADYWSVGRWALVNNLVWLFRLQILLWEVAVLSGAVGAASFQATQNVVSLVNPIILGICNIIPQTTSQAKALGNAAAWRAARVYAFVGVAPTFAYYALVLIAPGIMLWVFYGANSPYYELAWPLRLFIVAAIAGYSAEMISSFLHGANAAGTALLINVVGTAVAIALVVPLTAAFGLNGAFMALAAANAIRTGMSFLVIKRMTAEPQKGSA